MRRSSGGRGADISCACSALASRAICPECGGRAPLIRMSPDSYTRGKMETWTYECSTCGHKVEKTVTPNGKTG
jgi:hypothetical protein